MSVLCESVKTVRKITHTLKCTDSNEVNHLCVRALTNIAILYCANIFQISARVSQMHIISLWFTMWLLSGWPERLSSGRHERCWGSRGLSSSGSRSWIHVTSAAHTDRQTVSQSTSAEEIQQKTAWIHITCCNSRFPPAHPPPYSETLHHMTHFREYYNHYISVCELH